MKLFVKEAASIKMIAVSRSERLVIRWRYADMQRCVFR